MDETLKDIIENTLQMNCIYTCEGVLRNQFFFQDEVLEEDVALPMRSSYFNGSKAGFYGLLREPEMKKPIIDLFFLHKTTQADIYENSMDGVNYNTIDSGDIRTPLKDPLTPEEVDRSLADGTYQPLYDHRPQLNASWIRVKPFYSFKNKDNSIDIAFEDSMRQVRNFLNFYAPLRRSLIDVDFDVHDPKMFSRFLVGAEFSFADNVEGADVMLQRAKEVYGMFSV